MKNISIKKLHFLILITGEFILSSSIGFLTHMYLLPLIPNIKHQIQDEAVYIIEEHCEQEEKAVEVEVVERTCPIKVDISGALNNAGVYCMREDEVLMDAINKAGGFTNDVGFKFVSRKINLASTLENNQKIYIPFEKDLICTLQDFKPYTKEVEHLSNQNSNQEQSENVQEGNNEVSDTTESNTDGNQESQCININTGTKDQLIELNGIGESTAQKIIDARPFETIEDILNVSGIGDATFDKFKDQICL